MSVNYSMKIIGMLFTTPGLFKNRFKISIDQKK